MSEEEQFIRGHMTMADGTCVPLTAAEAKTIMDHICAAEAKQAAEMPTSKEAVAAMFNARDRLRRLGWREGQYCPKDGTEFAVIQYGSTGIFTAWYSGEWPKGYLHVEDCVHHPGECMWKPLDQLTEWEEEARQKSRADTSDFIDRMGRMAMSQ